MTGAIIRDQYGELCGFKVNQLGVVTPLLGEAEAAHLGVKLAYLKGFHHVILESDSELVIKAIHQFPHQLD